MQICSAQLDAFVTDIRWSTAKTDDLNLMLCKMIMMMTRTNKLKNRSVATGGADPEWLTSQQTPSPQPPPSQAFLYLCIFCYYCHACTVCCISNSFTKPNVIIKNKNKMKRCSDHTNHFPLWNLHKYCQYWLQSQSCELPDFLDTIRAGDVYMYAVAFHFGCRLRYAYNWRHQCFQ